MNENKAASEIKRGVFEYISSWGGEAVTVKQTEYRMTARYADGTEAYSVKLDERTDG